MQVVPELDCPLARIRVLLVDDHPLFRAGVRQRLSDNGPDLNVVGEAGSSSQARDMVRALTPDVVVMDIAMPGGNGIEATREIKRLAPKTAVIILSLYDDIQYVEAALEAGASGYFLKTVQGTDLATAVRGAHAGDAVLSPELARVVFQRLSARSRLTDQTPKSRGLSGREVEVLQLVAQGMPNKEIAKAIQLSVRTVEAHLRSIFAKLQVGSRTEAVILAVKDGIIILEEVGAIDDADPDPAGPFTTETNARPPLLDRPRPGPCI